MSVRIGICPVISSSLPSLSWLVANLRNSQAVARFWQLADIALDFSSEKVWIWLGSLPLLVGIGTAPHLTLSPYTAIAHGPTIAMAAFLSPNESPLYGSFLARPSAYSCFQNSPTATPSGVLNCGWPPSTSCLPVSAMNSGEEADHDWKTSLAGAGQMAPLTPPLSTSVLEVARNSS